MGPFVGGHHVHAAGKGGADVTCGRFAVLRVQGGEFDQNFGAGTVQESSALAAGGPKAAFRQPVQVIRGAAAQRARATMRNG